MQIFANFRNRLQHYSTLNSILLVSVVTGISSVAAFGRELIIAYIFGTSAELDSFLIALLIPSLIGVICLESLQTSFVPHYVNQLSKHPKEAWELYWSTIWYGLFLTLCIVLILLIGSKTILSYLGYGFADNQLFLANILFFILVPILFFRNLSLTGIGVLNSHNDWAYSSSSQLLIHLIPIIGLAFLIFVNSNEITIYHLTVATVFGYVFQFLYIQARLIYKYGIPIFQMPTFETTGLKSIVNQHFPMILGALVLSGATFIDQSMASINGEGSVAMLTYGRRLTTFLLSIGGVGISAVYLPVFSTLINQNDFENIKRLLIRTCVYIFILSFPVVFGFWFFSDEIVQLVFQRGAFTEDTSIVVGKIQKYYVLQAPFYLIGLVGVRLINALKRNDILMKISLLNLVINVGANIVFMKRFGLPGIALSTSLVYTFSCIMILLSVYHLYQKNEK